MRRQRIVFVAGGVLVLLVGLLLMAGRLLGGDAAGFDRAMRTLPASTLRATYTDWAVVREQVGGGGVQDLLDRAFEADLVSTSALTDSAPAMSRRYGVSPLTASWEALGQDDTAQVVVLGFEDGADLGRLEQRLDELGYDPPAGGPGEGGTWAGGADLVAALDPDLSPVLQAMAVLPDEGLVLMSDTFTGVSRAVEVARGDAGSLADEGSVGASVEAAGDPVTAMLWAGDFACRDLAMAAADPEDQRAGEQLVDRVGGVAPLTGLVMAAQRDGVIRVGLSYASDEQASADLQARVDLAAGAAPGQGGTFAERFRVAGGEADGATVRLELVPVPDASFVFSDISTGPVLFATC